MSYTAMLDIAGQPLVGMVRRDDGAIVLTESHDPNSDTDAFQAWLAAGNTVGDPPPPPASVAVASGAQLGAALRAMGLETAFLAALSHARVEDQLYWGGCYRDDVPVSNPKLKRILAAASPAIDPAALFAQAVTE